MPRKKTKTEEFIAGLAAKKDNGSNNETIMESTTQEKKSSNFLLGHWKKMAMSFGVLLLVAMSGAAVFFYREWKELKTGKNQAVQDEVEAITGKIGKFMALPADETPTMATVNDQEKLKSQTFFAQSQNGDKVLIYTKSQKAILYRPSTNQIIEVMALSMGEASKSEPISEEPEQTEAVAGESIEAVSENEPAQNAQIQDDNKTYKVVVLNGTNTKGLAKELSDKILQVKNVTIGETGNAKGNYKSSLAIDLTGGNNAKVQEIASLINGTVGDFPSVETKPEADILVIGGE